MRCGKVLVKLVFNHPQFLASSRLHLLTTRKTPPSPHNHPRILTHLLHSYKSTFYLCLSITFPHFPQSLLIQPLKKI